MAKRKVSPIGAVPAAAPPGGMSLPSRPRGTSASDEEVFALFATVRTLNRRIKTTQIATNQRGNPPLSEADLEALFIIGEFGTCTAGHLARTLCVPATTATTIVDRLVARKLAQRERSDQDRRSVWLRLTRPGERVLAAAREDLLRICRTILAALDPDERQVLARLLQKIGTEG
jgi:DNA-binding MarR family transcriptional regulator